MRDPVYNPQNWYWSVVGSSTQVFSSAAGDYVPVGNATYQAWLAAGNTPTPIDTEANLGQVLAPYGVQPANANVLDGYKTALAGDIVAQVIFKVLFNHENRIRTIERALSLNGSPPNLTQQQALNAVKSLM
jgi:hypothetical protein